ncbi:DUF4153 domain-containing protein [Anaerorhabdus furcosa]|uniref:Uncharacterized protein n=1 Tax=Anaerorhabdus furcosa TaxID=118967 RepID=A0A1T4K8P2_9FIRM|nr:DUF4173 domain-containing protein [Anaerorhabdus furcosa]SJZ38693.1 protein of unknown function [Anaerorhabdus furcosa]
MIEPKMISNELTQSSTQPPILNEAKSIEKILGFIFWALGIFLVDNFFNGKFSSLSIFFILLLGTLVFYLIKTKKNIVLECKIGIAYLACFSLSFTIFNNEFVHFMGLCFMIAALIIGYAYVERPWDKTKDINCMEFVDSIFVTPFTCFGGLFKVLTTFTKNKKKNKTTQSIIIGLCIAGPLMVVILSLLVQADYLFMKSVSNFMTEILEMFNDVQLDRIFVDIVFGSLTASFMYGVVKGNEKEEIKKVFSKNEKRITMESLTMIISFVPLLIVYLIFFVAQITYYTNGIIGQLPLGYTYAEYARSGFFELIRIAVINLIIIMIMNSLSKNNDNKTVKYLTLGFSIVSIIMGVLSMSKMLLYISAYGLTTLRIVTMWFMILLLVFFVFIITHVLNIRFKTLKNCLFAFLILFTLLTFMNVDGVVGWYNTSHDSSEKN